MKKLIRSFIVLIILLGLGVTQVLATCDPNSTNGPDPDWPSEWCTPKLDDSGGSKGIEVYSCGNYFISGSYQYACYWHTFNCDTPCAGGGGPTGTACPPGKKQQSFYSCDRKVDGCTGGSDECNKTKDSNCEKCNATQISCVNVKCVCATTKASNIVGVRTGGTTATIDWTKGLYATNVRLYVGANQTEVNAGCTASNHTCAVKETALPKDTVHYEVTTLDPAILTYYIRIDTWADVGSTCNLNATSSFTGISCPVMTTPSNLTFTTGANPTIATLDWTPGTGGSEQKIYVGTDQAAVEAECSPSTSCLVNGATVSNAVTSFLLTGITPGITYYAKVVNYDGASACAQSSSISDYSPTTGTVYVIDDPTSCTSTSPYTAGGLTVTFAGTSYTTTVGADGTFSITAPGGVYTLTLGGIPAGFVCSTACNPLGCSLTGVTAGGGGGGGGGGGSTGNNFYLTAARESWWQAEGANIYAGSLTSGVNIRSVVPPANQLIIAGALGDVGVLMRAAGTASYDSAGGELSAKNWQAVSKYRGKYMNYEFFAAKEGLTSTKSSDWAGNTLTQPTADARDFWYMEPISGAATVANQWVVLSGEQYVIMVDGDLDINANITVANGGFLAFVVNGNVSVDPAVTDVQGLYVIDGVFASGTTGAEDVALTTEGSIVAWGGVSLSRDLGSDNTLYPGEKFVYRPDLIVNMPDKMRSYALEWSEVPAGTFNSNISN